MAQLGFAVAGAAIGNFVMPGEFMGMSGSSMGWMAGAMLYGSLQPGTNSQGPRIGDLKITASGYGKGIPLLFGSIRAAGSVIWAAEIAEHSQTQSAGGGKGGGGGEQSYTTYSYTCSFATSLCVGPIAGVRKIWANGNLIYNLGEAATIEEIIASNATASGIKFYLGNETQLPDPTIEAHEGSGNVPAYRGQAYAVFTDVQLADYGNRLPNLEFEVVKSGSVDLYKKNIEYIENKNYYWSARERILSVEGAVITSVVCASNTTKIYNSQTGDLLYTRDRQGEELISYENNSYANDHVTIGTFKELRLVLDTAYTKLGLYTAYDPANPTVYSLVTDLAPLFGNRFVLSLIPCIDNRHVIVFPTDVSISSSPTDGAYGKGTFIVIDVYNETVVNSGSCKEYGRTYCYSNFGGYFNAAAMESDLQHVWLVYMGQIYLYELDASNDYVKLAQSTNDFNYMSTDSVQISTIWADKGYMYCMTGYGHTGGISGSYGVYSRQAQITPGAATLQSTINALLEASGLSPSQYDTSALTDTITGYGISQQTSGRGALEQLLGAFNIDGVESGDKIKFIKRGTT